MRTRHQTSFVRTRRSTVGASCFLASLIVLAAAGAVTAKDHVGGDVNADCHLPPYWSFAAGVGGGADGQFANKVWRLPNEQFAATDGAAVTGGEIGIHIRGLGFCNTAHRIEISSLKGGLVNGDAGVPPAGFANRRAMTYRAYWVDNGSPYGPAVDFTPSTPSQTALAEFHVIDGHLPAPGGKEFNIYMGMQRGALATPLVAGDYSDTITVTLTPSP